MYGSYAANDPETPMDHHTTRVVTEEDEDCEQEHSPRLRGWALRVGLLATATLGVTMLRHRTQSTGASLDLGVTATSDMPWQYTGVEADSTDDGSFDSSAFVAGDDVPSVDVPSAFSPALPGAMDQDSEDSEAEEQVVDLEGDADQDLDAGILVGSSMRDALLGSLIKGTKSELALMSMGVVIGKAVCRGGWPCRRLRARGIAGQTFRRCISLKSLRRRRCSSGRICPSDHPLNSDDHRFCPHSNLQSATTRRSFSGTRTRTGRANIFGITPAWTLTLMFLTPRANTQACFFPIITSSHLTCAPALVPWVRISILRTFARML